MLSVLALVPRRSVALLTGLLMLGIGAAAPAAADAAALTPRLLGTHPSSPGLTTTPRVHGTAGEVITTAIGGAEGEGPGPFAALAGEEGTIVFYGDAACSGPQLAEGPSGELEGQGIPVPVAPGSTTEIFSTQTDASGTSACSNGIVYRHVTDPPGPAVVTGVSPASPADHNFPLVVGSADPDATVAIFTNSTCSGTPVGSGDGETFSDPGVQVAVPDNSTTTFYAQASWAQLPAACSSTSATYAEVTVVAPTPPPPAPEPPAPGAPPAGSGVAPARPVAPTIHTVPGGRANDSSPLVAGRAPGSTAVSLYRNTACSGAPAATVSPAELSGGIRLRVAENAVTSFFARSTDASGTTSVCSEEAVYVEDSAAPVTRITFGPGVKTRKRSPVFRFTDLSGDPPGTTFFCKLDRQPWQPCGTPWKLSRLSPKSHLARVRAVDAAGNEEAVAAKRRFRVVAR